MRHLLQQYKPDILSNSKINTVGAHALLLIHHKIRRPHGIVRIHDEFIIFETSSSFSKHLMQPIVSLQVTKRMQFNLRSHTQKAEQSSKGYCEGSCIPCQRRLYSVEWPSTVRKSG